MKYLIVSADDFGLAKGINEGIVRARGEGIVTSINVMPSGNAFFDAVERLNVINQKEVGAHLSLTASLPVTEINKVKSLVTAGGAFHKSYSAFFASLFSGKINKDEVYRELKSQLDRVRHAGLKMTSLSSHEHIHMMPEILKIFIALAKEYGIPSVRYLHKDAFIPPLSAKKIFKKMVLGYFDGKMGKLLKDSGLTYTDYFMGFLDAGNIKEDILIGMIDCLKDGTTELVSHPGFLSPEVLDRCVFHRNCETDLAALTSRRVKRLIEEKGIKLIPFSELTIKV